jgi:hypothetical protein
MMQNINLQDVEISHSRAEGWPKALSCFMPLQYIPGAGHPEPSGPRNRQLLIRAPAATGPPMIIVEQPNDEAKIMPTLAFLVCASKASLALIILHLIQRDLLTSARDFPCSGSGVRPMHGYLTFRQCGLEAIRDGHGSTDKYV